ncbi:hypothetical protein LG047_11600 [Methylocystis sp. WRRC1]|uniref:hypothetical protein n=1 Tax=Methylocystis sp. WRRC1 TaxID=1732014 RepID=UPI001D14F6E6|nr:hypothetical protein [Methylocystis sp. WRRC1]MCC3245969.1 hypothetical protein [Methylocystis sp. WRRC1]
MKKLSRNELLEAARKLRAAAEGKFVLPETCGFGNDACAEAKHDYFFPVADRYVRFMLEVEPDPVSACPAALRRLPLKFKGEVVTLNTSASSRLLDASELNILILAFLLGVNLPMQLSDDSKGKGKKLLIGMAPTLTLDCGVVSTDPCDPGGKGKHHQIVTRLYELSKEFFDSEAEGLEFWAFRVVKSLGNRPGIAVEGFASDSVERGGPAASEESESRLPAMTASRHLRFAEIDGQKFQRAGALIEVPCIDGEKMSTAVTRRIPERKSMNAFAVAAAVFAAIALIAAQTFNRPFSGSSPQMASVEQLSPARAASSATNKASGNGKASNIGQQIGADEMAASNFSAKSVAPDGDGAGNSSARAGDVTEHANKDGAEAKFSANNLASPSSSAGAASGESRGGDENPGAGPSEKGKRPLAHAARPKSVAVSKRKRQNDSLSVIGRTVDGFAKQFTKDLRRLPGQISSIFNH